MAEHVPLELYDLDAEITAIPFRNGIRMYEEIIENAKMDLQRYSPNLIELVKKELIK